jgi:4-coumarate--CoA ligase
MVVKSKHSIDIPQCSLPTLIFGSPHEPLPKDKGCLFDHLHPETRFLSRHTYRLWAQRLATGLRAAGLQRGDRVVVFSTNHLFYPVIFMGVIMAGGIFSGCNPTYSRQELAHQIRDADPAFVFTQGGEPLRICREAIKSISSEQHRSRYEKHTFVADDRAFDSLNQPGEQGLPYWSSLFASEAEGSRFVWDSLTGPNEAKNTIVALNYSSGTTGLSKGVEITHGNYVSNIVQYDYITATVDPVYDAEVKRTQKLLCFLPLYHAMAQMLLLGVAQYRGAPVYIMEKFDFLTVLQNVEKFRITDLTLVPPVVVMLAKRPETKKFDLSSVVRLGSGAAPLSREVSEEAENLWPKGVINIKQGWGMTECV